MKIQQLLEYLKEIGCDNTNHSGRSLLDHLKGTYDILKSWDNKEYVCLAGLFHSIYGSRNFSFAKRSYENRFEVVQHIGSRAELLVFFFSLFTIEDLINTKVTGNKASIDLKEHTIEISGLLYNQLVQISIANITEQFQYLPEHHFKAVKDCRNEFKGLKNVLGPKAYRHFMSISAKTERSEQASIK